MKGVCTGQKTVELTGHLGSCCGTWKVGRGRLTIPAFTGVASTELVLVRMMEIDGVANVLSG